MLSKLGARTGFILVSAFTIAIALCGSARAQLPPPGAYKPIPNFVGTGAGLQFRTAINDRFSGVQPISPTVINIAFADLPDVVDGMVVYCNDCQVASPCTGGGAGALALAARGLWNCIAGSFSDAVTGGDLR